MTDRKFYRHVFQVEVLSEENLEARPTPYCLGELAFDVRDGPLVGGSLNIVTTEKLNGRRIVTALRKLGSEPEFFQLTSSGNDQDA